MSDLAKAGLTQIMSIKDQIELKTRLMNSWYASGFTVAAMLLEEEITKLKEKLDGTT